MWQALLIVAASHVCAKVFSPNDDLLSFPQYQIIFPDTYVLDTDAESSLALASSYAAATESASSVTSESSAIGAVSTRGKHGSAQNILERKETYEYMILDSEPYLCSLPIISEQKNETETPPSKDDEARELARATDRGSELLKGLDQCLFFTSGWWSYSFCHQRQVKQFHALPPGKGSGQHHPREDESVPSFVLGQFPKTAKASIDGKTKQPHPSDLAKAQTRGDTRYMVQKLQGGDICDITGRPRKVEIQFHCHPQSTDRIGLIKEVSTCAYLMIIYTSRLCNDVAFEPSKQHSQVEKIECKPILSESEVESWRVAKSENIRTTLNGAVPEKDPSNKSPAARPVVGNIELGGHVLVGGEGRRIEAPKAFTPEEQAGEVVVRWHPSENNGNIQQMTEKQLHELDLDPAVVQEMQMALEEIAAGFPWSLRVVEKANGVRELRGIVEGDGEGEGELPEDPLDATYDQAPRTAGQQQDDQALDDQNQGSKETYKDEL